MSEKHLLEELRNVVHNYPLWPGDAVAHETAKECARLGWIRRDLEGNWIPTAVGLARLSEPVKEP